MANAARLDRGLIDSQAGFVAATRAIMPALRGYARRLTQNDASGEDLVQETLVRAWAARTRFLPGSNFKAWLFRIARNTFLNGARRSWRSTPLDPIAHEGLLVGPAGQEDALYSEDLDRALEALPAVQREALLLVVEEGMTYDEAAISQHVEPGTLRSRVSRARSALMRHFDNPPGEAAPSPSVESPPAPPSGLSDARDNRLPSRYDLWKASGARTIG